MNIASFEDCIDHHGGDIARWPASERMAADRLLAGSPAARALLAEMRNVEAALHASRPHPACGADHVAARASAGRQETRARRVALQAGIGTAVAAVLALGVLAGAALGPAATHDMSPDRVLSAAMDAGGASDVD